MIKGGLLIVFCAWICSFYAQEEDVDPACKEPSKKCLKAIETAKNTSDIQAKVDMYNRAIQADPDNAGPYYEYGMFAYTQGTEYYQLYPTPQQGDKSYRTSEEYFEKALSKCENFHAGIFYHLGIINYAQKDQESSERWFRKFLDYNDPDNNRYPYEYPRMKKEVTELLKKWEEQKNVASNLVPFEPFKVPQVNTPNDEYFPMLSPDNELIFYTRKLDRRNMGEIIGNIVEEFTFSQRPSQLDKFDPGTPFKKPFNDGSFKSYGAASMSVDNKEMVICACQETMVSGQKYLNCDLYQTKYTRTGKGGNDFNWTPLENLGPYINTPDGWEGQPSLSADGKTLYFTATRKNTRDNDIFISKRQADGTWGVAYPFNEINTAGKDKSPFIHPDNETFYFVSTCSEERQGAGGLDIFYIRKQADGTWTKPVNIGVPINTPDDELGLFVSTEGSLAYYSSRAEGDWGIYGFELYLEARPESVVIVKGNISNDQGEAVQGAEVEVAYENGTKESFRVNGEDGKYAAAVKVSDKSDVAITVKKDNHAFSSTFISKKELVQSVQSKVAKIEAKDLISNELVLGQEYEIADIFYQSNSAIISPSSKLVLKQFANYLLSHPNIAVEIGGHTDDVGDDFENLQLSEERAKGVRNFLIAAGVEAKRLSARGYGEMSPRVMNDSEENRALNRRTVFRISKL